VSPAPLVTPLAMAPVNSPCASAVVPLPMPIAKLVGLLVQPPPAPMPLIDAHVAFATPVPPMAAAAKPDASAPISAPPASLWFEAVAATRCLPPLLIYYLPFWARRWTTATLPRTRTIGKSKFSVKENLDDAAGRQGCDSAVQRYELGGLCCRMSRCRGYIANSCCELSKSGQWSLAQQMVDFAIICRRAEQICVTLVNKGRLPVGTTSFAYPGVSGVWTDSSGSLQAAACDC